MSLLLMAVLQGATTALPVDFDLARLPARDRLAVLAHCDTAVSASDIVVCASRHEHALLPVPDGWIDPDDEPDDARVTRGTGTAALTPVGACGIFAGERQCSKADAAHFGYGRGRDPVTFFKKLATKLIDPDAN
jgi:hypothetical protein